MNAFQTEIVVPNDRVGPSGFFKVVLPVLFLTILVAFTRGYYPQNGYDVPPLLNILLILMLIVLPIIMLFSWYHNIYQKSGRLAVSEDELAYEWEGQHKKHFPIEKLEEVNITYDGYAGGPTTGNDNVISFVSEGKTHSFNFRLDSQEKAEEMGDVIKKWYEKGVKIKEQDTDGTRRYLMLYDVPKTSFVA